jgi:hypothetical protein
MHHYLTGSFRWKRWIVPYDDVRAIRELYADRPKVVYRIGYGARRARMGEEIMFFSDSVRRTFPNGSLELVESGDEAL